jgi:hypothetical protein
MASSPGVMELSDPPGALSDPFNSFPLSDPTIILGDTDTEVSSPTLPYSNAINTTAIHTTALPSSDFLEIPPPSAEFSAASHRLAHPIRKRGLDPIPNLNQTNKTLRFSQQPKSPRDLILNARDLIVQAYTLTKAREEQSKLLDLLEVFREYTEKGRLQTASTIIASQVANLELATRQIENKARALAKAPVPTVPSKPSTLRQPPLGNGPPGPPGLPGTTGTTGTPPSGTTSEAPSGTPASSYASIAGSGQEWTLVKPKAKPKPERTGKPHRLILVRSVAIPPEFSSLTLRNAFNKAFEEKGVKGPVINTVTKSLGHNLVVSTTSQFSADYLLENQPIWEHLVSFRRAQKDEPWHKVVLHGIPIADFDTPSGMELVIDEVKTFNKGFNPIGTPYWLSSPENRAIHRGGSVVVAFPTAEEANRAIRHRLYIAGISVRVEKLYSTASTTQCSKCQGFGHLENYCKREPICKLCGEKHATQQHACRACSIKGSRCLHLVPKCANCKGAHTADNKACEVLIAIRTTKATTRL